MAPEQRHKIQPWHDAAMLIGWHVSRILARQGVGKVGTGWTGHLGHVVSLALEAVGEGAHDRAAVAKALDRARKAPKQGLLRLALQNAGYRGALVAWEQPRPLSEQGGLQADNPRAAFIRRLPAPPAASLRPFHPVPGRREDLGHPETSKRPVRRAGRRRTPASRATAASPPHARATAGAGRGCTGSPAGARSSWRRSGARPSWITRAATPTWPPGPLPASAPSAGRHDLDRFRSAAGAVSVVRPAGAAAVPIASGAPGFQARDAHLPLLLRGVASAVHANASHAVAEGRVRTATGKATAHG